MCSELESRFKLEPLCFELIGGKLIEEELRACSERAIELDFIIALESTLKLIASKDMDDELSVC